MRYEQANYLSGLSAQLDRTKADSYPLLINGRVRDNVVTAIRAPLQDTSVREGLYQNLTAVGSILILFVDGIAFYRDVTTGDAWRQVLGLALDPAATVVDTCVVAASTLNFKRSGPIEAVKFTNSPARETTEGILATDGVTQPAFVYPEPGGLLSARATQTYAQWTESNDGSLREYVPVGRYPRQVGDKLYMAIKSPAGYLNRIAQSVSGRPLDFVVQIDNDTGDKAGDALTTAIAVGFDDITGIYDVPGVDSFVVTTTLSTHFVTPDFTDLTFFGEPRHRAQPLFPVGVLNNHAAVDVNGDVGFVSTTGILSFNATGQSKIASNSDPISKQIYKLLAPEQTFAAAADFGNYGVFAVNTVYGPGVVVYDKTLRKFVSVDLYDNIGQIKQFAKCTTPAGDRLFFITNDNRLFEYDATADTYETCRFYVGDLNSGTAGRAQRLKTVQAIFTNVVDDVVVQITEYTDRQRGTTGQYPLTGALDHNTEVVPNAAVEGRSNAFVSFSPGSAQLGFAVGALIEWRSAAKLAFVAVDTIDETVAPATLSQMYLTAAAQPLAPTELILVGKLTPETMADLPVAPRIILLGDVFHGADPAADYADYAETLNRREVLGVAGEEDTAVDGGLLYRTRYTNGKRYYSQVIGDVELFFYNIGWTAAEIGTTAHSHEPDGFQEGSPQAAWLRGAMAASTAKFKIVVLHFNPLTYVDIDVPFHAYGAHAVVAGHDAGYSRTVIDGLPYYNVGTGGVTGEHGYLWIKTDAYNVQTAWISHTGAVSDRYLINT